MNNENKYYFTELNVVIMIVTKHLDSTDNCGKTDYETKNKTDLTLRFTTSIPNKYICVYNRMSLAKCQCEWPGVLNLANGIEYGKSGCFICNDD